MLVAAACSATGDFGRPQPSFFADTSLDTPPDPIFGPPAELFMLTDDERELRDLAFLLIAPSYPRDRWDANVALFGQTGRFHADWTNYDHRAYSIELSSTRYRSATARYARLTDDARSDITRIRPFFLLAWKVADLDQKREKALRYVHELSTQEVAQVKARISENMMVTGWVHRAVRERSRAYRYALERLVIATPSPMAVESERALNELVAQIKAIRIQVAPTKPASVHAVVK